MQRCCYRKYNKIWCKIESVIFASTAPSVDAVSVPWTVKCLSGDGDILCAISVYLWQHWCDE
jgi:hypothetical protein